MSTTCSICNSTKALTWHYKGGGWTCNYCYEEGPTRGIYDAYGKPRDREWLNKKLALTRTEKGWHEDIMSRRILPDGKVGRVRNGRITVD